MCITANFSHLTGTFIASYVVGRNHRLIYQNETETQVSNAMILAIPGEIKKLTAYPKSWVSDLYDRLNPVQTRGLSKGISIERVGSYIVGHTKKLDEQTSFDFCKENGLEISQDMINWFHKNYKKWNFVIAVFKPENTGEMHPIAIDYKAFEWLTDIAFIPMVEGHGNIPELSTQRVHQTVIVNNVVIIGDRKLKTTNDDLYVKCNVVPGFNAEDMFNKKQLFFEQNPENLIFYTN